MELNGTIGERLTELMEEHGTDVKALARQMNADPTTVRRWKRGATSLRAEQLIRLAELYSCSLEFLTGRSDRECSFSPKACPPFYPYFRALLQRKEVSRCEIHAIRARNPRISTIGKEGACRALRCCLNSPTICMSRSTFLWAGRPSERGSASYKRR